MAIIILDETHGKSNRGRVLGIIARENNIPIFYNGGDLVKHLENIGKKPSPIWDTVDEAIERSKIVRYPWTKIFGRSLTQEILFLKKEGFSVEKAYDSISKDNRVLSFIERNIKHKEKILENIKISTHARYGENNTANKVMEEENEPLS